MLKGNISKKILQPHMVWMNYCEPSFCYECKLEDNDLENGDWEIILETAPKQRQ